MSNWHSWQEYGSDWNWRDGDNWGKSKWDGDNWGKSEWWQWEEDGDGLQEGQAASTSHSRPAFQPEHRPGEADWDPFMQEARGKRSREDRKARRANSPSVQQRRAEGLKEGYPPNKVEPLQEGSRKWRMIKEREKEVLQEEDKLMLERKQLLEERAAFLEEKAKWLEEKSANASPPGHVVLKSVSPERPERRQKRHARVRRTKQFKTRRNARSSSEEEEAPESQKQGRELSEDKKPELEVKEEIEQEPRRDKVSSSSADWDSSSSEKDRKNNNGEDTKKDPESQSKAAQEAAKNAAEPAKEEVDLSKVRSVDPADL